MIDHHYALKTVWTGDRGQGTADYRSYGRDHTLSVAGKPDILGSADKPFRGDVDRWNPEEMLLGALSQCHLLSYLWVCTTVDVVVTGYVDDAVGTMVQTTDGGGHFTEVVLRPTVTVADESMVERARAAHREASEKCFIASSMNFPVRHEPTIVVRESTQLPA
ncbi:organic hydroperoxide reductase OsmC/OhrA [Frondihabitans sp. PhB188]|uniref:OsmC family protein n=1 Tax=Frondihabitans sp. PhB188 TaxID=2485200 RepID=UPI000F49E1B7|nr:OsmC family protein [Frondihabitans sp. PhB188]ROQ41270.1 organic hydroperoxide reductase OsmC/OhrA [Frondihabitans sp. PhB188]